MSASEEDRFVRPPSAESLGEAPGRARLAGRRILVVGGGQRVFDPAAGMAVYNNTQKRAS